MSPRLAKTSPRRRTSGARASGGRPLPRAFYARHCVTVARATLGRILVFDSPEGRVAGRIVEVEAYRGRGDAASHAHRGPTARNAVMFGVPGRTYVYFTYGMHHCLNLVTERAGVAAAVLVRALEPVEGLELMRARRGAETPDHALARGPGNVARALGLTRAHDGLDLTSGPLWLSDRAHDRRGCRVARGSRIGIRLATGRAWRFFLDPHPCVSARGGGAARRDSRPVRRGSRPGRARPATVSRSGTRSARPDFTVDSARARP